MIKVLTRQAGCILIPGCLDEEQQLEYLEKALAEYTLPPNPLNLSTHYDLPSNLFQLYAEQSNTLIRPLTLTHRESPSAPEASAEPSYEQTSWGRKTVETPAGHVVGYDETLAMNREWKMDPPSEKLKSKTADELLMEIRWANLGLIYQVSSSRIELQPFKWVLTHAKWSVKSYDFRPENAIPFPSGLGNLCREVVRRIPWSNVFEAYPDPPPGHHSWADDYGEARCSREALELIISS